MDRGRVLIVNAEGQEDRDYWNNKYAEAPECEIHGDTTYYEPDSGEWECYDCIDEEDMYNG